MSRYIAPFLILLCAVLRIVPHPPNFTPVGAAAVFAGRVLRPGAAVAGIVAAMLVSNAILSLLHGWALFDATSPFVYAGFAMQALLGRALRGRRGGAVGAAVLGAGAFFILSNFGVWVAGGCDGAGAGLAAVYVAGIPFLGGTLVGDVAWTLVLTRGHALWMRRLAPGSVA
jgi:hypothetical protein